MRKYIKSLFQSEEFRKYFSNTSWLLGEKIFRMAVNLVIGTIFVARYLGPEKFGILNYALSFVFLFSAFSTLGLDGIVIRNFVKNKEKRDVLLGTTFILKLCGAGIVIILLLFGVQFTSNDNLTNIYIFIIGAATVFQSFNVIDFYYQSIVQSKYVVYSNIITLCFSSLLKLYFIFIEASLLWFVIMFLIDSIVLSAGLLFYYLKRHSVVKWKFSQEVAKKLLLDSWPLILSGVFVSIYMKVDQVMIKEMLNIAENGKYAAAVKISELWYFVPTVITASLFPAIVKSKEMGTVIYNTRLQQLYDFMFLLSVAFALPMTFLSDWLIIFLYGEAFNEAGEILKIHVWAGVFVAFGLARGKWLIIENLQKYSIYYLFAGALANIALNIILIPNFGILGAAIATFVSYGISTYIAPIFFKETRDTFIMQTKSITLYSTFARIIKTFRNEKPDRKNI
jgi:O-antigen/teichoic acid export membrane protein